MHAESEQSHSWVRLGEVFGAVAEGRLVAVVYQAVAQRGRLGGPGGDAALTDPGWYLVWTDEPHRHYQLATPPTTSAMSREQLEEAGFAALAEAGKVIDDKLRGAVNDPLED